MGMNENSVNLNVALSYAARGWPVFPLYTPVDGGCSCGKPDCQSIGKHPRTPHGLKDATTDEAQIIQWWTDHPDANIGLVTGSSSKVVAVDVDPRHQGEDTLQALQNQYGSLPDTLKQFTGGGGYHLIFQAPTDGTIVPNSAQKLGPGIDVRGEDGYIVAAPSLHASGQRYEWVKECSPDDIEPAPPPDWLFKLIVTSKATGGNGSSPNPSTNKILAGSRNDSLYRLARRLHADGLGQDAIKAALTIHNQDVCKPPLDQGEVERIACHAATQPDRPDFSPPITIRNSRMLNESEATKLYPLPVLLDEPSLPDFSEEAFPEWMNDMVNAVARHTETPRGLAAMNGLAVLGTCCQKKFQVSPKPGYIEPTNIWVMPVMESGNRKTAVLNEMTAPLSAFERIQQEQMDPERKRIESERATRQAQIDHLRQQAARKNSEDFEDKMREIAQLEESLPEVPHVPRLWAQDITPEQLGPLMAENNEKLSLISDEGGIFETFAGRYNDNLPNLDLLLKSHSGSDVRIDRRSRPPLMLSTPALTIGVSPQPEVLRGLTKKQGFRGRGLLARFWYMLPSSPLGYRTGECPPIPPDVLSTYKSSIFALLEMNSNTNEYGQPIPHILTFTDQAHHKWKHFFLTVEKDLQPGRRFEFIKDWAGKLPGAAARIAGLLHCAKHVHGEPGKEQIDLDTMTQTLNIAAVLCEHALYAFDVMEADLVLEDARWVWRWIERERETYFSARDCFQALKGKFRFMKNLTPALSVLLERHYLYNWDSDELGEGSKEKRRGRRSSPLYFVNPHLTEGWE